MKQMTNTERLSKPTVFIISVIIFFILIIASFSTLWYATAKIEYPWRWYKVPSYIAYVEEVTIEAEEKGKIEKITETGNKAEIIFISNEGVSISYIVPVNSYDVDEGRTVYKGDTIAEYQDGWKPGVLLQGLWVTLYVSLISTVFGITIGVIGGLMRVASNPLLKWTAVTYVELIRGSPLLVQIFLWYYVFGSLVNQLLLKAGHKSLSPAIWGIVALSVFTGAYVVEMVRAGIEAVHFGQTEAARSCGMTYFQCMIHIILPQALRTILPPLAGQFINLIKDSSLIGIISVREILRATREVITRELNPFEMFMTCAVFYLILTFTLSMFVQYLERRTAKR